MMAQRIVRGVQTGDVPHIEIFTAQNYRPAADYVCMVPEYRGDVLILSVGQWAKGVAQYMIDRCTADVSVCTYGDARHVAATVSASSTNKKARYMVTPTKRVARGEHSIPVWTTREYGQIKNVNVVNADIHDELFAYCCGDSHDAYKLWSVADVITGQTVLTRNDIMSGRIEFGGHDQLWMFPEKNHVALVDVRTNQICYKVRINANDMLKSIDYSVHICEVHMAAVSHALQIDSAYMLTGSNRLYPIYEVLDMRNTMVHIVDLPETYRTDVYL